jgi:hypothetical protein
MMNATSLQVAVETLEICDDGLEIGRYTSQTQIISFPHCDNRHAVPGRRVCIKGEVA